MTIPISLCPSRRNNTTYPNAYGYIYYNPNGGSTVCPTFARTDYAGCAGDANADELYGGPTSLAQGDDPAYGWPSTTAFTGIFYQRSQIKIADITKGTSNQLMLGEKYLNPNNYTSGTDGSDNECMYTGMNNDVLRCTFNPPMQDRAGVSDTLRFGSPHPSGCLFVLGDGSVRSISYSVDATMFKAAGHRQSPIVISLN
jgi:hypothetical protein